MADKKGGEYGSTAISEEMVASATVSVTYVPVGAANSPMSEARPAQSVALSLTPGAHLPAVPGSVLFGWMGHDYSDNGQGVIFRDAAISPPGVQSGVMDYAHCVAVLDSWVVGDNPGTITLKRLWTRKPRWTTGVIYGRTASAPIKAGAGGMTLTATDMSGAAVNATVDATGLISGPQALGAIDLATGAYQVQFGELVADAALTPDEKAQWWYSLADVGAVEPGQIWRPLAVDPTSIRYNAVTYEYLPIDAALLGLKPERLRPDGRAPFVRPGDYAFIGVTIDVPVFTPAAGMTIDLGSTLLSSIDVIAADGSGRVSTGYTRDLDAGTLTINSIVGWPAQVGVRGRAGVYRRAASVRTDGTVRLTTPVGRTFPAGATLSTALRFGNKQAFVERVFDQASWNGVTWLNVLDGNTAPFTFDTVGHPIQVNNRGTRTERWALKFRNDGVTFDCYGEHLGLIASGNINEDFAPPNPQADNAPYLVVPALGWGGGQVAGNVLFVHTVGAEMGIGAIRTLSPGQPVSTDYEVILELRGNEDRPPSNPFTN